MSSSSPLKVIILPGNGCTPVRMCNWYGWLKDELLSRGITAVLEDMPDPHVARESVWLPFVKEKLKCDEHSIIVGHSSGAEAAMRLVENTRVTGIILVSACITDLGDDNERASGYYNRPWLWDQMKTHIDWSIQFGAPDDPFLPIEEQRTVASQLGTQFHELKGKGHYMTEKAPEVLAALLEKLEQHDKQEDNN